MDKKQKQLDKILQNMKNYNIQLSDIAHGLGYERFDLLCIDRGELIRVPFSKGKDRLPVGIFPFEGSSEYLCLCEDAVPKSRKGAREYSIPTLRFWKDIFNIKEDLNQALKVLNAQTIKGKYYAEPKSSNNDLNCVICFNQEASCLFYNFHSSKARVKAKLRYCGNM